MAGARKRWLAIAAAACLVVVVSLVGIVGFTGGLGSGGTSWKLRDVQGIVSDLDFQLTRAGDGKTITEGASNGKIRILFFGYTHCPDICPMTLALMANALTSIDDEQAQQVQVYFASVDPNRDTRKRIAEFASAFNPSFVGLRGSEEQMRDIVKRYNLTFSYGDEYPNGDYLVSHSAAFIVFDRAGDARLLGSTSTAVDALASDLSKLVSRTS